MTKAKIQLRIEDAEVIKLDSTEIDLSAQNGTDISLNLDRSDVKDLSRKGSDLIVELNNGEIIVIDDYYKVPLDGKKNRLFISDDSVIAQVDTANLSGVNFADAGLGFEPLIFGEAFGGFALPLAGLGAVGGGVAAAAGGGGSGGSAAINVPAPTIDNVIIAENGIMTVTGMAVAGASVSVVFPDGSTVTIVANEDGTFGPVTSATPQTSGDVTATQTDPAGNPSPATTETFTDTSAPLAPTLTPTANPDGTLSVSGTGEPGSEVEVTFPDGTTGTTTVAPDGTFGPVTSATPQTSGDVTATQTDPAGNPSPATTETFTDTSAPLAPTLTPTANPDGTLSVSGTGEPGSTATVTFPDGTTGTTTVAPDGTFGPVTSATPQTSGDVTATQTDPAGNPSPATTETFTDTSAPLAPTLTPTANPDGTLSVSGTGEPGSTATVTFPDGTTGTTTVAPDGTFGPVTSATPQTSGDVTATQTDPAGNPSPATTETFTDTSAPLAPTLTPTANPDGTLSVSGTGEPGSTATVTFPDGTTGTTTVAPDGTFGPVTSATPQTSGDVTATQTDPAGNPSPDATEAYVDPNGPLAPTIDTLAANPDGTLSVSGTGEPGSTATVTFPDGSSGTAPVAADGTYGPVTSTTPQTSGDVTASQEDAAGNTSPDATSTYTDATDPLAPTIDTVAANPDGTLSVSGTGEPGSTATVTFPDGTTGTTTVAPDGTFGPVTSATPQTSGDVTATQTDPAGNPSPATTETFTDTSAPLAPTLTPTANPDGTLSVSGTGEPGSEVEVTFPDGTTGTTTVAPDGTFGPVTSATPQTSGDVTATQTDPAGNPSPATTETFTDTSAPLAPTLTPTANPDGTLSVSGTGEPGSTATVTFPDGTTGTTTVAPDGTFGPVTSATPQTSGDVTATQQDDAGNTSPVATEPYTDTSAPLAPTLTPTANPDGTLSVSGTGEPGSTATVTFPDGTTGTAPVAPDGSFGPITSATPQTTGDVTVVQEDDAGNPSPATTETFTDSSAPLAPTVDTVTPNPDGTLSVSGTGEPGSTATVTFPDGTTGTAPVAADGTYGPVTSSAPQTSGDVTATQADAAGNPSPATTQTFTDTSAPLAPTTTSTPNPDGTLSVSGTGEPGSTVTVTFPDGTTGTTPVAPDGSFGPITSATPQTSGDVTSTQEDAAGNPSPTTTETFTDTSPPLAPTVDNVVQNANGTITFDGTGEPGSTIDLVLPSGETINDVPVAADGTYGPVSSTVTQPDGNITATQTDAANNTSGQTVSPFEDNVTFVDITSLDSNTITGTAEALDTVDIDIDNDGTVDFTTSADADGNWSQDISSAPELQPQPFFSAFDFSSIPGEAAGEFLEFTVPAGVDPETLVLSFYNASGNIVTDNPSSLLPNQPEITLQEIFNLTGVPGSVATSVTPNGGTPLDLTVVENVNEPGSYVITIPATGGGGPGGIPSFSAASLTLLANPGDTSGTVIDTLTNDPAITMLNGGLADGTTPVVYDTEDEDANIAELDSDGNLTFVAGGDGSAQLTGANSSTFADINVSVTATDAAGNTANDADTITDYVAPFAPIVAQGDGTVLNGTGEPGATVNIDTDGDGTVEGTALVQPDGTWTFTPATPVADTTAMIVTQTDAAGNTSGPADVDTFVDITSLDANTISGTAEAFDTIEIDIDNDGTVDFTTSADATGNWSQDISSSSEVQPQPFFSGFDATGAGEESGEFIEFTIPAGTDIETLVLSLYNLDGNLLTSGSSSFFPTQPEITVQEIFNLTGGVGSVASNLSPNGGTPLPLSVLENSNEPGSYVITLPASGAAGNNQWAAATLTQLANPGDTSGELVDSFAFAGAVPTLSGGLGDGVTPTLNRGTSTSDMYEIDSADNLTAIPGGDGSSQLIGANSSTFADINVSVTATDAVGNTANDADVITDYVAPFAPIVAEGDGSVITGTGEPGATVNIDLDGDGTVDGTALVQPDGSWSFTPPAPLIDSSDLVITQTDTNGNESLPADLVDLDNDGNINQYDIDDDGDGIIDTEEDRAFLAFSSSTDTQPATGITVSSPTSGYVVDDQTTGSDILIVATAPGENGTDAGTGTISEFTIDLEPGDGETITGLSASIDIPSFDDGLVIEIDGTRIVDFNFDDYNSSFFGSKYGDGNGSLELFRNPTGEGNPELVLDLLAGTVRLLVDLADGSGRGDVLVDIEAQDLQGDGSAPFPNAFPAVNLTSGVTIGTALSNADGPGRIADQTVTISGTIDGVDDIDNDSVINSLDTDSDGDGISDTVEAQGNGPIITPSGVDSDNNGLDDAFESAPGAGEGLTPVNTDVANATADNLPDYRDTDSDNDGILDNVEGEGDVDGDGIANYRDLDSDGDGILDANEGAFDFDNDGQLNFVDLDSNNDGINDRDTDGDGIPDDFDDDSDGDGISNADEQPNQIQNAGFEENTAGLVFGNNIAGGAGSTPDVSPWVFLSANEANVVQVDGAGGSVYGIGPEFDAELSPDGTNQHYLDVVGGSAAFYQLFSVGGAVPQDVTFGGSFSTRNGQTNLPVEIQIMTTPPDVDGNPTGGGTIVANVTGTANSSSEWTNLSTTTQLAPGTYFYVVTAGDFVNFDAAFVETILDTDNDGIVDNLDLDSDNDGIVDAIEGLNDADGDGIADYRELDSNNDGISDREDIAQDQTEIDALAANTATYNATTADGDAFILADGGSLTLDLTAIDNANITDVERIDITGDANNSLVITAQDVLDLSSTSDEVIVLGDTGDSVTATGFTDTGVSRTIDGQDYNVFESGGATLIVDQDINTTI